ncbi:MAG TPA: Crp/Fnr family transcriptional regulator [Sphingomonas bacterium]|jgi:CRP-like cAMP-binding protein|uniref:Crp/Fnr family transcriptional regulator n=1 Tax=Sphingomonas bacterium TaxID=1895847 RepID=A0A3D0WAD9_9SPHN|nr:Crp/Fnr family transcriptional regulator [Sphingomonas bacterium]
MLDRILDKLQMLEPLSAHDRDEVLAWSIAESTAQRHGFILRQGDRATRCAILKAGLACRWKMNRDGVRQIVTIHYPGDMLDLQHFLLDKADHHISALTPCDLGWISYQELRHTVDARPAIGRALWRDTLIEAAIGREWLLNIGRRDALQRLAHLLTEMSMRMAAVGTNTFQSPNELLTQEDLADACGLTPVHVNRTIQKLRTVAALPERGATMTKDHLQRLTEYAGFDPAYLHHLQPKTVASLA